MDNEAVESDCCCSDSEYMQSTRNWPPWMIKWRYWEIERNLQKLEACEKEMEKESGRPFLTLNCANIYSGETIDFVIVFLCILRSRHVFHF